MKKKKRRTKKNLKRAARQRAALLLIVALVAAVVALDYFFNDGELFRQFNDWLADDVPVLVTDRPAVLRRDLAAYYPLSERELQLIEHSAFSLGFNDAWRTAAWVVHRLNHSDFLSGERHTRTDRFLPDPFLANSPVTADYLRSGFDRGHLAPAADFSFNADFMRESFYMSNIAPQYPNLNRILWNEIEQFIRRSMPQRPQMVIFTGPIHYGEPSRFIGNSRVAVPDAFYKIAYDEARSEVLVFVANNIAERQPGITQSNSYMVTLADVERLSELTFLQNSPNRSNLLTMLSFAVWGH
ncbi:MAG: DNA/RNA non-specific endonuclease [Spirochaetaceae bacterium]|nr:DNA/RNA non-specific endonuclease [Spirochaetaceae bacterium]